MNTLFSLFLPVTDDDDPQAGPSFYFQSQYDKLAVVPGDALNVSARRFKRGPFNPSEARLRKR